MSATLDGARVAKLLGDAPVVESEGRAFPVETRYLGRKLDMPLERQMADTSRRRYAPTPARCWRSCRAPPKSAHPEFSRRTLHDAGTEIVPLFGAVDAGVQDRAIAPAPKGTRKVVLATPSPRPR